MQSGETLAIQAVVVQLSQPEIVQGALTGVLRQIDNVIAQRKGRNGVTGHNDWQLHIEGALGEQAVAKWLGAYWSGAVGNLAAADVKKKIEVRTTHRMDGSLILHDWDKDDAHFFLVTGLHGTYRIVGWIEGRAGKQQAFWRDPVGGRSAYFVPQAVLSSPHHFMRSHPAPVGGEQMAVLPQRVEAYAEHATAASGKPDPEETWATWPRTLPLRAVGGKRLTQASTSE